MKEIEILKSQLEYSAKILNDVQQDKKRLTEEKENLFKEAKRELARKDREIAYLKSECERLYEPTKTFWNMENQSKIDLLSAQLDVALEALQRISEIGYYHDYGDHRAVATKALEQIRGIE